MTTPRKPSPAHVAEVSLHLHNGLTISEIARQLEESVEYVEACAKKARKAAHESTAIERLADDVQIKALKMARQILAEDDAREPEQKKLTVSDIEKLASLAARAKATAVTSRPKGKLGGPTRVTLVQQASENAAPPEPPGGGDKPERPLKIVSV